MIWVVDSENEEEASISLIVPYFVVGLIYVEEYCRTKSFNIEILLIWLTSLVYLRYFFMFVTEP